MEAARIYVRRFFGPHRVPTLQVEVRKDVGDSQYLSLSVTEARGLLWALHTAHAHGQLKRSGLTSRTNRTHDGCRKGPSHEAS